MLLAEAATIAEELRNLYRNYMTDAEERSKYFRRIVDIIREGVKNSVDDSSQLVDMYYPEYSKYPRQLISFRELRDDVCLKLSISPLVWDESLTGKPMVPMLALESPEYGGEGMTVKQALNLMSRIRDEGFFKIASKMNEREALLFWGRATDERPPMPVHRFLQMVSYSTEGRAWDKIITPADVYADVVSGSRRYLHITEFPKGTYKGVLYNRHKQMMGKPLNIPIEQECILEVEVDGIEVKHVTDIFSLGDEWDIYKSKYNERADRLTKLQLTVPVKSGKFVPLSTDFSHMLETLDEGDKLRFVDAGPIQLGGNGGWVILKDAFHINLLVSAVKRDEQFETHVRLSALDGFETYEVGQEQLTVTAAQHMRQRLAHQGILAGQDWLPVDEYAMVVVVELSEFSLSELSLQKAEVHYLDDGLGYSDVSQLTDLIEMSG